MNRSTPLLSLALLLFSATAAADEPGPSVVVEVYGGAHLVLDDWDFHRVGNRGTGVDHGAVIGLRLGGYPLWWLGIEGGLGVLPLSTDVGANTALDMHVGALFHVLRGSWSPYLAVGGGLYSNLDGDLGRDKDFNVFYGVGVVGRLNDWLGLRLQARHLLTDGYEGDDLGQANNLEITAALRFDLWRKSADRDGDGWADAKDECPDQAGHDTARGCPDRDGDGVPDSGDDCPNDAGPDKHRGCPDRDGDGVPDARDRCPDTPGDPALQGCTDRDGDGVVDGEDRCPDEPEDQDGFQDPDGCPDTDNDGDGIADTDDECPNQAETKNDYKDADGCPDERPVVVQDKAILIRDRVFFDFEQATIKPESFEVLGAVAKTLTEHPEITRVRVAGHTDDVGTAERNLSLSQRRADAVRRYLVSRGVAASRLETRGYGATIPLAKGSSEDARAQNRRVEFEILSRSR